VNKQEWDGKKSVSAQGHHDILQDFEFSVHLKIFSGVPLQAKYSLKLSKPKAATSITVQKKKKKKKKNLRILKRFCQKVWAAHREVENTQNC
jgi:hypothetical protein